MLRLPEPTFLPDPMIERISRDDGNAVIEVPGEAAGTFFAYRCDTLVSLDQKTLFLSLGQERNGLGRGLVRSLWFDRPVYLWLLGKGSVVKAAARAYRCLIAGPEFAEMLARARQKDPRGDIACAWQLTVESWEETTETPPHGEALPDEPPELHFDNPVLRKQ